MKAIGYIRVSTQGQAEDGVSLDAQEAKVRSWADYHNAEEVVLFRDEGISGKRSDNRPGLEAALDAIGKGDALVVYSLSRLSRSTKDTLSIAEALAKKDADLVSMTENIDTTSAAGKMIFRLLAVLAEFERDQVSDRTRFALAHKKANGEKTGGDVPFGYRARKGKLYQHVGEQKTIALILTLRKKGESLRAICRALESKKIARKGGGLAWHPQSIADVIKWETALQTAKPKGQNPSTFDRSLTNPKSQEASRNDKKGSKEGKAKNCESRRQYLEGFYRPPAGLAAQGA